jgi:hypothetical protein
VQQEIATISDAAVRAYYEKTQPKDRTPKGVHDVMTQAATAATKGFRTEFDKQSAVANPKNGVGFLEEVCNSIYLQMNNFHVYFLFLFLFCFWLWFWFCLLF